MNDKEYEYISEVPTQLLKLTYDTYLWATINGPIRITVPSAINKKAVKNIEQLFLMVIDDINEKSYE